MQTPVAPERLILAQICTFNGCFGLGFWSLTLLTKTESLMSFHLDAGLVRVYHVIETVVIML